MPARSVTVVTCVNAKTMSHFSSLVWLIMYGYFDEKLDIDLSFGLEMLTIQVPFVSFSPK